MPLEIGQVDSEIDVQPTGGGGSAGGASSDAPMLPGDTAMLARLRPMVIEIVEQELARLRREQG